MGDYVTHDSGERQTWDTGMQRDTSGDKARFDLIVPAGIPYEEQLLTRWARLMQRGAVKYNARNWEKASTQEELARFRESAIRHFMEWFMDADDGEDHAVAVLFNIMGAEYTRYRINQEPEPPNPAYAFSDPNQNTALAYSGPDLWEEPPTIMGSDTMVTVKLSDLVEVLGSAEGFIGGKDNESFTRLAEAAGVG
jgi:hypothetical protein